MSRSNLYLRWVSNVWTRFHEIYKIEKPLPRKQKLHLHKSLIFSLSKSFLILMAYSIGQKPFSKNWSISKLNLVSRGTRLIDINYLRLCNTLLQIWCIRCYTQLVLLYDINYSLLSISSLHVFCSTIWNFVEHKLLFPVAIICCILLFITISAMFFMTYSLENFLLLSITMVRLYQRLISLKYYL